MKHETADHASNRNSAGDRGQREQVTALSFVLGMGLGWLVGYYLFGSGWTAFVCMIVFGVSAAIGTNSKTTEKSHPTTTTQVHIYRADPASRIATLKGLSEQGLITSEEFEKRKEEVLSEV